MLPNSLCGVFSSSFPPLSPLSRFCFSPFPTALELSSAESFFSFGLALGSDWSKPDLPSPEDPRRLALFSLALQLCLCPSPPCIAPWQPCSKACFLPVPLFVFVTLLLLPLFPCISFPVCFPIRFLLSFFPPFFLWFLFLFLLLVIRLFPLSWSARLMLYGVFALGLDPWVVDVNDIMAFRSRRMSFGMGVFCSQGQWIKATYAFDWVCLKHICC